MNEITELEAFHPRAMKLMLKRKPFIVIACDEPYYMQVYSLIRENEMAVGRWSDEDERVFRAAELPLEPTTDGTPTPPTSPHYHIATENGGTAAVYFPTQKAAGS